MHDFMPIDVALNYEKHHMVDFFNKRCVRGSIWWDMVIVRSVEKMSDTESVKVKWNESYKWIWDEEFENKFPSLIDDLYNKLPFRFISSVLLLRNFDVVHPHCDISINEKENDNIRLAKNDLGSMESSMYRIVIDGSINNSFFLSDKLVGDDTGRKWVGMDDITPGVDYNVKFVSMPPDTNIFALTAFNATHGSVIPDSPKIIMAVHGFLDEARHSSLLTQSYDKYKSYGITY